ncbi:molybdopterin-guanine dinucleotide biosynthesis protein B [Alicyclobacillus dauci]|uniref:Molybdopterin-guanine dinucleotide biosynthesis protein B n=1 Tax=Alicyclobacillus dauci TaxID=1475485 RepID=A0ABY6Z1F9_9BACL|nr:molybdopterin-guanine dinucleotide biosynthesis protein B [Alicyclobacillus dauci]WAH36661.1 molybdopterin-guanine dinucleotide biosynthesis protein B [Alicyclobacillus dauci]
MHKPNRFAVVGYQDAGKTQVTERIVREASQDGLAVAVIKHDGHADTESSPDWEKPSSDTVRAAGAGAQWTMVASRTGWLLHAWKDAGSGVEDWTDLLVSAAAARQAHVDLVIIEGAKHSPLPKLAVVRTQAELDQLLQAGVTNIFAVCWTTETRVDNLPIPQLSFHGVSNLWEVCSGLIAGLNGHANSV